MQTESSVQFNLGELMRLEEQRVAQEQAAEAAKAERQARALAQEAEKSRLAAERAAEQERAKVRDEEAYFAQLSAEREVALLRVRVEVEQHARMEEAERQRAHERALRKLDAEITGRRYQRTAVVILSVALVAALAQLTWLQVRPDFREPAQASDAANAQAPSTPKEHGATDRMIAVDHKAAQDVPTATANPEPKLEHAAARVPSTRDNSIPNGAHASSTAQRTDKHVGKKPRQPLGNSHARTRNNDRKDPLAGLAGASNDPIEGLLP